MDNEIINEVVEAAFRAREMSYSPYSGFAVGAAVKTTKGQIYVGTNVENVSFGLTICAERAALSAAVTAGDPEIQFLAVVADSAEPVIPCGACRQVLAEFNPNLEIVSATCAGHRKTDSLKDLLPSPKRGILSHAQH